MRAAIGAIAIAAVALASGLAAPAGGADSRAIDVAKSSARFSIQHIFVGRVTGTIPILSGEVTLAAASSIPASVTAVLDATKLATGEPDRDAALRSPDYFDTRQFPTWTFASTKIAATGPDAFGVDGALTMHGTTQPEHLDVTVGGETGHPLYHAVGHIDRYAFGMRGARLDPVIGKTADIVLDIALQ